VRVPICKKLLPILKERSTFDWEVTTLRQILKVMGFKLTEHGPEEKYELNGRIS